MTYKIFFTGALGLLFLAVPGLAGAQDAYGKSDTGAIDQPNENSTDETVIPEKDLKESGQKLKEEGGKLEESIDKPNESSRDTGVMPQPPQSQSSGAQEAIVPEPTTNRREPNPRNIGLQMGLGVANYNGDLADNVDPGPAWDLRASFMNSKVVGGELAYTGATEDLGGRDPGQPLRELNGSAMTSAGDVSARLNMTHTTAVQPFVAAGLGLLSMDFRDDKTTVDRGTAFTIPVGAGLQVYTPGRLTFGGRFNYRVLTDLIGNDLPSGDNWNAGLNIGATF